MEENIDHDEIAYKRYSKELDANHYCQRLERAMAFMSSLNIMQELVHREINDVIIFRYVAGGTDEASWPFWLEVEDIDETGYIVDVDGDVSEEDPTEFTATYVSTINEHGVEFVNSVTGNRLHINGFKFKVRPVIVPDE